MRIVASQAGQSERRIAHCETVRGSRRCESIPKVGVQVDALIVVADRDRGALRIDEERQAMLHELVGR